MELEEEDFDKQEEDFDKQEEEQEDTQENTQENNNEPKRKYKYEIHSLTLTHYESARAKKALEIARNHFSDKFRPPQLKTVQAFIKTIGLRYAIELINYWEKRYEK